MLNSRGATTFQIGLLALVEGLFLALPAVALGPLLALGVSRALGRVFFDFSAGSGGLPPVSLSADAYLLGAGGALLAVAVLTISTLVAARRGIVAFRHGGARPPRAPFIHRYYVDILVLVLAMLILWQLQSRGSLFSAICRHRRAHDRLFTALRSSVATSGLRSAGVTGIPVGLGRSCKGFRPPRTGLAGPGIEACFQRSHHTRHAGCIDHAGHSARSNRQRLQLYPRTQPEGPSAVRRWCRPAHRARRRWDSPITPRTLGPDGGSRRGRGRHGSEAHQRQPADQGIQHDWSVRSGCRYGDPFSGGVVSPRLWRREITGGAYQGHRS